MSVIHWLNPVSGSFTNASYWSGGKVPGSSDDAILDAAGVPYTVTAAGAFVHGIQTDAQATLSLTAGEFTATAGTGSGASAGVVLVGAGAVFAPEKTFDNTGTISLAAGTTAAAAGELLIDGNTTFSGGGEIDLGQGSVIGLYTLSKTIQYAMINVDNTISGSGAIEIARHSKISSLPLINETAGVVDANGAATLYLNVNVQNQGLLEAQDGGNLYISFPHGVSNEGGTILAGDRSTVTLWGGVAGGVIESEGTGIVLARDGIFSDVQIVGNLSVGAMGLYETIDNTGDINVDGGFLAIFSTVSLTGGGTIDMSAGDQNSIVSRGYPAMLINVDNTIVGGGVVGTQGAFVLINKADGVIDADGAAALTIDTLANVITNAGMIESTGGAGGVIVSAIDNTGTLGAAGGALTIEGAVTGKGVAVIEAGTLDFTSTFNEAMTFTGKTGTLELAHSQDFSQTIKGFSVKGKTVLDLGDIGFVGAGEATFSGTASGGVLTVTDGTHTASITLKGDYLGCAFVASSDGHGGTDVIAKKAKPIGPPSHALVAAMAGLGSGAASLALSSEARSIREPLLALPRAAAA